VTAPHDPRPTTATWWEDEGRRVADQLHDVSAVIVTGASVENAARVALGIARAESERRHVALGDLAGDAAPLYAIAGGEDAFGLSDCLRQGLPLNDIARPAPDRESLFILPAGSPPIACEEILGHERWPRLVSGFAKVGALLLLVVPIDAPGIDRLAAAAAGVVLVDAPRTRARNLNVLATVSAPEAPRDAAREAAPRNGHRAALAIVATVVALAAIAAIGWLARGRIVAIYHRAMAVPPAAPSAYVPTAPPTPAASAPAAATAAMPPASDTVRLTDPVNPADTSATAAFAVEVMAANTLAGANSFLADNAKQASMNSATVSPVAVGGSASVWYKVVVGASHVRGGADELLASMQRAKLVRDEQGRVVKVPYALVLAQNIEQSNVRSAVESWRKSGFNPYVLVQSDGSLRVFAGAFETAAQAAPLASALRAAGVAPVLAFRTGRSY
jgi:hypothetical protein